MHRCLEGGTRGGVNGDVRSTGSGMGILGVSGEEVKGASRTELGGHALRLGFQAARGRGEGGDGREWMSFVCRNGRGWRGIGMFHMLGEDTS